MNHKELFDVRPWGTYLTLNNSSDHKTKIITVQPGEELSFQYHNFRKEVWVICAGSGIVNINNNHRKVKRNDIIQIEERERHSIKNISKARELTFIEVSLSIIPDCAVKEDDIKREKDKYGRVKAKEENK